ncbi:MAG: DinB family protein [bacterium]
MRSYSLLLLAAVASPALAQGVKQAGAPKTPAAAASAVADVRDQWHTLSGYVLQAAMDVPEDKYAFKPTPAVRSMGELFTHVAGAQSMFCAVALGQKPPAEDAVKVTTKADVVAALKQSNANCERAYAQSDAASGGSVDVFGKQHSRLYVLIMNATHDGEHYGNLVTYMRMNNMVPPSSK